MGSREFDEVNGAKALVGGLRTGAGGGRWWTFILASGGRGGLPGWDGVRVTIYGLGDLIKRVISEGVSYRGP